MGVAIIPPEDQDFVVRRRSRPKLSNCGPPAQTKRSSDSGRRHPGQGGVEGGQRLLGHSVVMTPGAWQRPRWCVSSWGVATPGSPGKVQRLAMGTGASGWMRCSAGAAALPVAPVLPDPGGRQNDCKHEEDAGGGAMVSGGAWGSAQVEQGQRRGGQ
ncbi:hypothetical protein Cadr_000029334 [Camelus dromedarius]|uniref:Uncharacterized protein n=1 Tax=Camelus dromedarius TaxID=9838 RepID=A0A5N4C7N5_CAMDR|nr:hypothetical protein Cadr_000029334 [Camelus dromedarius]